MGNDLPERLVVHDQCNEWTRYSAEDPADPWMSNGIPYHREDSCAERMKKLRADIVQRIKDNETSGRNAQTLGYQITETAALAVIVALREVLALLDASNPEKESDR